MTIKDIYNKVFSNKKQPLIITMDGVDASEYVRNIDLSSVDRPVVFRSVKRDDVEVYNEEPPTIDEDVQEQSGGNYRVISISEWRRYMISATTPKKYYPSWVGMIDLYDNMEEDSHISGVISTLTERLRSKDYFVTNKEGEKDDETTKLFQTKWFFDFLEYCVNGQLRGFNLIQLGDFNEDLQRFDYVREINQKHVRIDLGGVVRHENDQTISRSFEDEPFKTWLIPVWYNALGRLNKAARWYIYKSEVARFWAEFNEMYGSPGVIGKTKLSDSNRKRNFIKYLRSFASTRYGVFDVDDIIETIDMKGSTSAQIYENFIRLADEQISKALLGSTMVMDNGSSRSQSEVHETNTDLFIESLATWVKFIINDDLLWRMREIGFNIPEGSVFKWDKSEKLSKKENAEVIKLLSESGYKVDADEVTDVTGFTVEVVETADPETKPVENILQTIDNKYKLKVN